MSDTTRFRFANALRGLAALAVLLDHYGGGFWFFREQAAMIANSPVLDAIDKPMPVYLSVLWPVPHVQWGAFGVALFFLISGFIIPISIMRYDTVGFTVGRVFRIYPTYIACFSITILSLAATTLMYGTAFPYSLREVLIHYVPGLRDLMWSRHIDGIIWTLEIELKFYVVCALTASFIRRGSLWTFLVPVLLGVAAVWANTRLPGVEDQAGPVYRAATILTVSGQMLCFMFIGTALQFRARGYLDPEKALALILLLGSIFLLAWSSGPLASVFDRAWSYGAALFIFVLCMAYQDRFSWDNRILNFFADISYPLYVVHGVLGFVTIRALIGFGLKAWMSIAVASCLSILLAWIVHRSVEVPTQRLGQRLARSWSRKNLGSPSGLSSEAEVLRPAVLNDTASRTSAA